MLPSEDKKMSQVLPFATWDTLPDLAGAPEGASASSTVGRRMVLEKKQPDHKQQTKQETTIR